MKTKILKSIAATLLLGAGSQALADDAPAGVTLRAFSHAGTGCPADTVTGNFPVDGNEFHIVWGGFAAEVGNGAPIREKRKACSVLLDLEIPAGWQYTVEAIEYRGEVDVDTDIQGIAGNLYYFQGEDQTVRFNTLFDGPTHRNFRVRDIVDPAEQLWSPCGGGRALNLNFSVRLDNSADSTGAGRITFGNAGGLAATHLELEWRQCP